MDNQTAIWHPSGKYLAMTQDKNSRVGFYQVTTSNDDIQVTPSSEPLEVGNHLIPILYNNALFLNLTPLRLCADNLNF